MGKVIVSWSPVAGQGATTSNVSSLAAQFALDYQFSSLITHLRSGDKTLEMIFGKGNKAPGFEDNGVAAIERLIKSNKLQPNSIRDYTETIFQNRLDLMSDTQASHTIENLNELLLKVSKEAFDILWVDAHASVTDDFTQKVLENADLILINLPQNHFILENFFQEDGYPTFLKNKEVVYLLSAKDKDASIKTKHLKGKYGADKRAFPVYYSTAYRNAYNQQNLAEFFFRSRQIKKGHVNYEFFQSLRVINEHIAKTLGYGTGGDEEE